ncbi:multicopper oxidase family protein [Synechococcus sp. Lug-A]|uniref:multicopper oxidase family protein n=1 Tax=unclassified Synechococcus TaxID=2626047 RepID=UPI0020CDCC88|nr:MULTISPECIES: multicopper oxidase family protein [unclassified Synechococcus]MCP9828988.1 multicopper oxidase family protein [Synechococcus sp. L2F]MCP9845725.1 multicopper oxidase family protein [Synechococcus sp. Lug-A]
MTTPLRRRQVLGLGLAGLGTAVVGPLLWDRVQHSAARAQPAGAARLGSVGGVADLELVASATPGRLPGGPATLLTYNGRSPGPLLEVNAGDQVRLLLRNDLQEPTNLHFHGLHIPPTGSGDNVFLTVPPGGSFSYEFTLAKDHPAGLFYVHPHHHGHSADQVFGGLGGALVVRGDLDRIPEVAAASESVLVLKDFASADGTAEAGMGMGMERMLGREGPLLTVNGELNPGLAIPSGGLLRLRLLNASNARIYRLALEGHRMVLIATDGGAIATPKALDELLLAPGERADVLVQGNQTPGSYRLLNLPYQRSGHMGMGQVADAPQTLATLNYAGSVAPLPLPKTLIPVAALPQPERTRRFSLAHAMGMGMGGMQHGMGGMGGRGMGGGDMGFVINGQPFDPDRIDTRVALGSTEDWLIVNDDVMDHPFHLHINPFQVISRDGRPEAQRRWKDTVLVKAGEEVRIRVTFKDFTGRTVYHCHNLDHEDLGLMGVLQID